MKKTLYFLVFSAALNAHAQDIPSIHKDAVKAYSECRFKGAAASIMRETSREDIEGTKECAEAKIAKFKEAAMPVLSKLKGSNAAFFKDYYAAWVGSMRGLSGLLLLPRDTANTWSNNAQQHFEEKWSRFEIEAGI